MNVLRDKQLTALAIGGQFYKIFIVLNKNALAPLQQFIQEKKKTELHSSLLQAFQTSFTSFHSFLCSKK